jgi:transposase
VHLLRKLVFIEEISPEQKAWTTQLAKLLLRIKEAAADARANGEAELSEAERCCWLKDFDRLVKRAEKMKPPAAKNRGEPGEPGRKRISQPTPRKLIDRLRHRRDEVLRFMKDLSVPFDNNGSERDLRMIKLQQKISGCFRTPNGARFFCRVRSYLSTACKQGHSLLSSLEHAFNGKPLVFQPTAS